MRHGHGGNLRELAARAGLAQGDILDFSSNVNPLGPPAWLRCCVSRATDAVVHYPDPEYVELRAAIAEHHGAAADQVVVGNGTSDIIYALPRAVGRDGVIVVPAYVDYARACRQAGVGVREVVLSEEDGFRCELAALDRELAGQEVVFLGQPNNPTGLLCDPAGLGRFARQHPGNVFVVDEAFVDFVEGAQSLAEARPENVVVLRSMTKFYAVPGMRLGYALAGAETAELLREDLPPWSLNCFAERFGREVLHDDDYTRETRRYVAERRGELRSGLEGIDGFTSYPGEANFLLVRIQRSDLDAESLQERLLSRGIAIRTCGDFSGLDGRFFRVAVRTGEENARLLGELRVVTGEPKVSTRNPLPSVPYRGEGISPFPLGEGKGEGRRCTPSLMLQGTSSNAGKSILAAAFCRILLQDGYRVAPFKAQNMSLNSFVTRDGGEMGRAQVVQAQACRLDPEVRMNPVLLKPTTDVGSQVIVRGRPVGNMSATEYAGYKAEVFPVVRECYESLAAEHDVVVIEGAGSPSEINLKAHDIVNMRMAREAGARVLLAGDIDRGGVFASFVGTMELLEPWEREHVAGFLVNRFRGDASLLEPALDYTLRHTGRPVLGVVPYVHRLGLPEEDSVEFKSGRYERPPESADGVVVTVVDLAHISNFTDFDVFRLEPDVHLRVARGPEDLAGSDAIILPGSKNVIGDLRFLRERGLSRRLREIIASGEAEVVGVCAGFQMLGREIADPHRLESDAGSMEGLGALPLRTVFAREKTLVQQSATHRESGHTLRGYEIHHGQSEVLRGGAEPIMERNDGEAIGFALPDRPVWGTYLHGVFDADPFRRWFIDRLRARRGLAPLGRVAATYDLEPAFERLADVVRQSVDLGRIYELMGLE